MAHSEGTVISFLGLLEAVCRAEPPEWIHNVRGLMTIGSPIDKHLLLWPELFPARQGGWKGPAIAWRNYYDYGDPIGFGLGRTRAWLQDNGWKGLFQLTDEDDFGFTRYPYPGKAHVDYWNDEAVFGHFIETVVKPPSPPARGSWATAGSPTPAPAEKPDVPPASRFDRPPGDIRWKKWLSYVLPYVGIQALLLVAVYILLKAVIGYIDPDREVYSSAGILFRTISAHAFLLLGITVTSRIPRLTRVRSWRIAAWGIYGLSALAYLSILLWSSEDGPDFLAESAWRRLALATLVVVVVYLISTNRPSWGLKPLLFLGTAGILGIVVVHLLAARSAGDTGPFWPVALGAAGFFYLWWLAALIFDLIFVWHFYIRQSMGLRRLNAIVGPAVPTAV